ncbi:hypothetical protein P4U43_06290 [Arthrobacter sp. EH-1B-1]|uniref:Uncharacterized protein n=1 Tax=Arthrobacter vasquezii TaxID=2977629 RepID=A0ABT6CTN3_9MICC|nr:hypothetical protein [Arthrobacter vasquezii]MDF9277401.1 hypothetical protein [Arthrobacter vasquezii]
MSRTYRLEPDESFPDDLTLLSDTELEVLNSRLHRELDEEYAHIDTQMETQSRLDEVNEELNRRDAISTSHERYS